MSAPAPGSQAERRRERWDHLAAWVVAVGAHGLLLVLGHRSTDERPLVADPGSGPRGPAPVLALDADRAAELLARLGPPAEILEIGAARASLRPNPEAQRASEPALPRPSPGPLVGPLAPPALSASTAPALPLALGPRPQPGGESHGAAGPAEPSPETPEEAGPTAGPDAAGTAAPAGRAGESARTTSAAGGDDAPFLDSRLLDALVLYRRVPEYPVGARRQGREGTAEVRIWVRADGTVERVELEQSSGHGDLDRSALRAVGEWRFDPNAVSASTAQRRFRLRLRFTLAQQP